MNPFRRIFGLGPSRMASQPAEVVYDNGHGTRLLAAQDTSANAVAARHNFAAIYGADNMPAGFTRKGVVQVQDGSGQWQNVSGQDMLVPDMNTQIAALQAYEKTGIIGPQPQRAGSMSVSSEPVGQASASNMTNYNDPLALPASTDLPPEALALLNGISVGESGGAYDIRYDGAGGSKFQMNGAHPNVLVPGPHGPSSAAGRYMITGSTWRDYAQAGDKFDQVGQDHVAWRIAQDRYKRATGGDLLADLKTQGMSESIMNALTPTWAALGNQRKRGSYQAAYNSALSGAGNAPQNSGPSMVGNDTSTGPSNFGVSNLTDGRRANSLISPQLPTPTRNDASIVQSQQTLADQLPTIPSLVGRTQTQKAPVLITPNRVF